MARAGERRERAAESSGAGSPASRRRRFRFRGRSLLAIVLTPELPLAAWLADLDEQLRRSPSFFAGRAVVLDVSALPASQADLVLVVDELRARDVRVLAAECGDPSWAGIEVPGLPPISSGPRAGRGGDGDAGPTDATPDDVTAPKPAASLLLEEPVRSGQSVVFPGGDVTVVGSVASGAEVIAGGSIHVYGTLRGRAMAGSVGDPRARIFCRRLEAELLAIDGLYKTADHLDAAFRGRAVQAWLDGDVLMLAELD